MTWPRAVAVCVVALGLFSLGWGTGVDRALHPVEPDQAADFPNYYFGGERLRQGRAIYDSLEVEVEGLFGLEGYDTYPADPPSTVVLLSPLSLMSYQTAWQVWQVISVLVVTAVVIAVACEVGYSPPAAVAMAAVTFLSTPVRFLLERNHMEAMLMLCGAVGWLAWRRGSGRAGALWWGVATGLKLFPGMWLIGLADRERRRPMIAGLATAVVMLVAGATVVGADNIAQYLSETIPGSQRWYGTLGNYSLLSVGSALLAPWLGWSLVAVAALTLGRIYLARPTGPDRVFVMGTALALLLSPLAWLNYLVLAIPAVIVLSSHMDLGASARRRIGFTALVIGLVGWGPIRLSSEALSEFLSFVPTYALVALFVVANATIRETTWSAAEPGQL